MTPLAPLATALAVFSSKEQVPRAIRAMLPLSAALRVEVPQNSLAPAVPVPSPALTMVPLKLWGTLYADVNLPLLLLVTFLAGFLPTFVALHLTRWRLRQRIAATDRTLADLHRADTAPVIAAEAVPTTNPGATL